MWATSRALQGSQLLQSSPLTALSQPASVLPHRPCSQNPGSAHKTVLQALQRSGTGGHARAAGHAGNAPGMAARKLKQPTGSTSPQDSAEREALKALQQALDKVKGHGQNAGRSSTNTNTHELAYAGAQASGPQSSNTSAAKLMVQYLAELNSGVPQQQALSIYEDWPKVLNALVTLRLHDAQLLRQAEQAVLAACSQGSKVGLRPAARMLRCWARLGQAPSDTTLWALLGSVRGTLQEAEQEATRLMQQGPTQSPPAASRGTQPLQNHQQKSKGQSGARYKNSGGSSGSNTSMGGARPGVQGEGQVVRLEAGARALVELADALAQLLAPEPGTLSRGEPAVPVGWPLSSPPGAATAGSAPAGLKALPALALQMAQRSAAAGPPTPAQLMLAAAAAKAAERAPAAAAPAGVAGPLGATSPAAASASLARTVSSGNAKQASPAPSQPAAAVADGRSVPSLPPVSQAHLALSDWVTDLEACSLAHMRALNGAGLASLLSSLAALGARPSRAWLCAALRQLLHLRLHEDPGEGALHAVRTVRLASFCEAVEALGVLHLGGCHAVAVTAAQARAAEAGWPGHAAPKDQRSRSRSGEGQSRQQVHQPEAAGREKQQEHAGASLEEGIRADVEALQQALAYHLDMGLPLVRAKPTYPRERGPAPTGPQWVSLLWAAGALGARPPPTEASLEVAFQLLHAQMASLPPPKLARSVHAAALLGVRPYTAWRADWEQRLLRLPAPGDVGPAGAVAVVLSLAALRVPSKKLGEPVTAAVVEALRSHLPRLGRVQLQAVLDALDELYPRKKGAPLQQLVANVRRRLEFIH